MIGVSQPRGRLEVFRYDLPQQPDPVTAAKIAGHATSVLTRNQLTAAVIAGYGPGPMVTPVTDTLVAALRRAGVTLHDMLRVEDGRYWSYSHDTHPRCCPPEGVPFDPRDHPAATALTRAGSTVLADRAALAATVAPLRAGGRVHQPGRTPSRRRQGRHGRAGGGRRGDQHLPRR